MFFAMLLTLLIGFSIIFLGQLNWPQLSHLQRLIWVSVGVAWLLLDLPYLLRVAITARHHRKPFALQAARAQWVVLWLLRPIFALWWLAHFALGVWFALLTNRLDAAHDSTIAHVLMFFLVAFYGYAANGYLMLSVCALTRDETIRWTVWQLRAFIDIALALLSLGVWHA